MEADSILLFDDMVVVVKGRRVGWNWCRRGVKNFDAGKIMGRWMRVQEENMECRKENR